MSLRRYLWLGVTMGLIALIAGAPTSAAFGLALIGPALLMFLVFALEVSFIASLFRGR